MISIFLANAEDYNAVSEERANGVDSSDWFTPECKGRFKMDNDGIILMLALRMAQQSCYPEAYEKFCEAYNYMIDVRSLDLPKEEL